MTREASGFKPAGPEIRGGYTDGTREFWYVVEWPDGSALRFFRRWQATAAVAGWIPPAGQAFEVPGKPVHVFADELWQHRTTGLTTNQSTSGEKQP